MGNVFLDHFKYQQIIVAGLYCHNLPFSNDHLSAPPSHNHVNRENNSTKHSNQWVV